MSIWGHVFAATYDRMIGKTERAGLGDHRQALLADASGDVLEIGGGTGANLDYYGDGVRTLTIVEPEKPMLRRLQRHIEQRASQAKALRAPAEDLPFNDASFDVVVSTLVLCTVDDVPRAVRELHRVLRPGGRLLFIEHVRADDPALARRQDRMQPINVRVAHGCHPNRRTLDSIRDAGFEVTSLEHDTLKHAPKFIQPLIVGVATRRDSQLPPEEELRELGIAHGSIPA
ncbi:MAG TPA: class I SAM-dependent methyltransferase [Solirubrobacteraceae bacterium]|nr:class I SAM-dependent methyltransferase [Solirubrobacteraceae bacterium]